MSSQSDKDSKDIPLTCKYFQEGWGIDNMDQIYHVIPANELNEHTPTIKCDCHPKMEIVQVEQVEHYVVIHNSFLLEQIQKSMNN